MISVIIVNYCSAHLTKKAVKSVIREDEDIEIFVVDNTAINEERDALKSILPGDINIIFNEKNEGFGKACNKAYSMSKGEWIFLLNPDAYLLPIALRKLKRFLIDNPKAGAVGPRIYWDDEKNFLLPPSIFPSPLGELCGQIGELSKKFGSFYSLLWRWHSIKVWQSSRPKKQNALSGGHVMLRRSAIEKSGGLFDEKFFMFYEDSDLMYRLRKNNYALYILPEAEVVHCYHHTINKIELMMKSRDLYFKKNFKNDLLLKIADIFSKIKKKERFGSFIHLGKSKTPIQLDTPNSLNENWLFEWSPSSSFIPSVGYFGKGPKMEFSNEVWVLLGPGIYYGRFSNLNQFFPSFITLSWEVE